MNERPNTVSGLLAKRQELRQQIKKLIRQVRTLDAALQVLAEGDGRHKARGAFGERYRYIVDYLRTATGPVTVSEVSASWITHKALILDSTQKNEIRRRVRVTFGKLRNAGTIMQIGEIAGRKAWVAIPR